MYENNMYNLIDNFKDLWTPVLLADSEIYGLVVKNCNNSCLYFDESFFREPQIIYDLLNFFRSDLLFIHEDFFRVPRQENLVAVLRQTASISDVEYFLCAAFKDNENSDAWRGIWPAAGIITTKNFDWLIWLSPLFEVGYFCADNENVKKFYDFSRMKIPFLSNNEIYQWFVSNRSILSTAYQNHEKMNFLN